MTATLGDDRSRCGWATGDLLIPYHDAGVGRARSTTTAGTSSSWSWRRPRPGSAGSPSCAAATAIGGPSATSTPRRSPATPSEDVARLLEDPGIIRNRAKIESAVANARAVLELRRVGRAASTPTSGTSSTARRWSTAGTTSPRSPPQTELSVRLSKDLRRRGFRFVGPVVCYAHLQATGLVNDHLRSCFRWPELR